MKILSSPLLLALLLAWTWASAAERIDINTASHSELQKIKWVGPVIAQGIIDVRPFYSVDELIRVKGIGPARLKDIKDEGLAWVEPNFAQSSQPPPPSPETEPEPTSIPTPQPEPRPLLQPEPPAQPTVPALTPSKIDINAAPSQELQRLTGIGATLAQRIVEARPFYSVNDLALVRGIGTKTLADIKAQGLAWVNPSLEPPKIEKRAETLEKGLAAAAEPLKQEYSTRRAKNALPISLIALGLAVFSGITILALRKKANTDNLS